MPVKNQKHLKHLQPSLWQRYRHRHRQPRRSYWTHVALAGLLVVSNALAIVVNSHPAKSLASSTPVVITSPLANQKLARGDTNITGTAGADVHVSVFADDEYLGNVNANSEGVWSYHWQNPTVGQHIFRAKVVDGVTTTSAFSGDHSVRKYGINSAERQMQNTTGFSFINNAAVDTTLHVQFLLNAGTGFVSVIDTNSNTHVKDIDISGNTQLIGTPNIIHSQGVQMAVDETTHKLFVLGFEGHVSIINTQTQTLTQTLSLTASHNYHMLMTPDHSALLVYGDRIINRIDVSSNAVSILHIGAAMATDESTNLGALYDPNADQLYYVPASPARTIDRVSASDGSSAGSLLMDQLSINDTILDMALSADFSKLFVIYQSYYYRSTYLTSFLTSDFSSAGSTDAVPAGSHFLTKEGIGSSLYLSSPTAETLTALNTDTNAYTDVTGVAGKTGDMNGQRTPDGYYNSVAVDRDAGLMYFITVDTFTQESVLNTVDLTTNTAVDTSRYSIDSSFNGAAMVALDAGHNYLTVVPSNSSNAIYRINLNNQSLLSPLTTTTTGPSSQTAVAPNGDVFSIGRGNDVLTQSYLVTHLDGQTGQVSHQTALPSRADQPESIIMNSDGTDAYVVALTVDGTKVYRLNTATDDIDRTYNAVLPLGGSSRTVLTSGFYGDTLYLTVGGVNIGEPVHLVKLNLQTDTMSSAVVGNRTTANLPVAGLQGYSKLSLSQDGGRLLYTLDQKMFLFQTADLSQTTSFDNPIGGNMLAMQLSADGTHVYLGSYAVITDSGSLPLVVFDWSITQSSLSTTTAIFPDIQVAAGHSFIGSMTDLKLSPSGKTLFADVSYALGLGSDTEALANIAARRATAAIDVASHATVLTTDTSDTDRINNIGGVLTPNTISVQDQSSEAQVSTTIVADEVTITSPADGSTITNNNPTIAGRAPAGSTVQVDVDGATLGSATSDGTGNWQLPASQVKLGSHTIHAQYTRAAKNAVFVSENSLLANMFTSQGLPVSSDRPSIDIFNAETKQFDGKISLPDGLLPYFTTLSADGNHVLVVGISNIESLYSGNGTPDLHIGLYLVDTKTDRIVSSVDSSSGFASDVLSKFFVGGSDALLGSRLSPDGSKIYLNSGHELYILNTAAFFNQQSNYVEADISLPGPNVASGMVAIGTFTSKLYNDGANMIAASSDNYGFNLINLSTHAVTTIPSQTYATREIIINQSRHEAYAIAYHNDVHSGYQVYVIDLQTNQVTHTFSSQDNNYAIRAILSADSSKLYIAQNQWDAANNHPFNTTNVSTLDLDALTSSDSTPTAFPTLQINPLYANLFGGTTTFFNTNPIYAFEIGSNTSRSDQYTPNIFFGLLHSQLQTGQVVPSDPNDQQFNPSRSYMNMSDEFSGVVPAAVIGTQASFTLRATTTPPVTVKKPVAPLTPSAPSTFVPLPIVANKGSDDTRSATGAVIPHRAIKASTVLSFLDKVRYYLSNLGRRMPRGFLTIMPYLLLLLLLAVILTYLYQTRKELVHDTRTREQLKYHTMLASEKNNFLQLVSHYLRTPLTVLSGGIEMSKSVTSPAVHQSLESDVSVLNKTVEALLGNIENDANMQQIETEPILQVSRREVFKNKFFYLPAAVLAIILVVFYLLFFVIGHASFNFVNLGVQILATGLCLQLLYNTTRNKMVIYHENKRLEALDSFEKKLDSMRAEFIREAQYTLVFTIDKIQENIKSIPNEQFRGYAQKGVSQLQELMGSFQLVSQLADNKLTGTVQPTKVKNTIEQAIAGLKDRARNRGVTVLVDGLELDPELEIEPSLLILTVKGLVANAIDASPAGAQVTLKCTLQDNRISIQVIDHGRGLTSEQLTTAFKPFGRVEDVENFDKSGLGLGLFTGRMFAHAFRGELNLESVVNKGTIASLTLPLQSETTVRPASA